MCNFLTNVENEILRNVEVAGFAPGFEDISLVDEPGIKSMQKINFKKIVPIERIELS